MRKYINRHIYIIGMIVLATLALTACDDELKPVIPDEPSLYEEGYISIDIVAAKAPTRGVK